MGSISVDGPGQHNLDRSEDPWGNTGNRMHGGAPAHRVARLRTRYRRGQRGARRAEANRTTRAEFAVDGKARLKYRPSSRTGENPLSGMIGGTMETAASFEARFAPSSYLTTPNRPCREIWCRRRESNDTRLLILCNLLQTYERKNHTNLCMPASYV